MTEALRPLPAADVPGWDAEADVVIAGFGTAGSAAAAEAAGLGADVLVLERTSGWESAAGALAGGLIYMGGGTDVQKACGFEDTADNMFRFLMAAMGPGVDEERCRVYCDGSVDHFDWLVACGVPFKNSFWETPAWEPPLDDGLMYSGGENAYPFNEMVPPAPRAHVPQMEGKKTGRKGGGWMLLSALTSTALSRGAKVEYDTFVERLVTDADGSVVGLVARRYSDRMYVRARGGVVLSTGSFTYADRLLASHSPWLIGRPGSAVEAHDGRSMLMAQALGGDVRHMDAYECALGIDPALLVRGILVNNQGQRFINEDTYPGRVAHAILRAQDNDAFLIIDEEAYEESPEPLRMKFLKLRPTWVASSAAELEVETGLPGGTLEATLTVWNRHAEGGRDPVFHKASKWVRPIKGSIGVIDLRGQCNGFTLGGLATTVAAEVLHVDGEPITGLYAAGRAANGIPAWGYASGTSLGDSTFFGRRAGRAAADRAAANRP
ncbi:MAG TPA: FAD-dependent oxidoreductase [Acidimicrobiales bacterium]|nr:FAD-dependent oxidoreductase [Acidimicrobiales bacterium]